MQELYQSLGFSRNPFSTFSAEEEINYLNNIFNPPRYYNSLFTDLNNGASRFIFGERGIGKTALMYKLKNELSENQVFTLLIDDYDDIPTKKNAKQLLSKIIKNLTIYYSVCLLKNPQLIKKLNKYEKEKLAFIITVFFSSMSKNEYEKIYNNVTKYKNRNIIKNVYNWLLCRPINIAITSTVEIASDLINKSLGLSKDSFGECYKEYLPQIKLDEMPSCKIMIETFDYAALKNILKDISTIVKKSEIDNIVIFFDKIDEFRLLEGKVDNIVEFIKEILQDTSLLQINNLALVFVIWTKVKNDLNASGVRFDKFKPVDVTWTKDDILQILELRLLYFSIMQMNSINNLLEDDNQFDMLISLSNKSPRDLLHLLSYVYDQQAMIDINSTCLSKEAVDKGIITFVTEYDFYSKYPSTKSRKQDIISTINKLLKLSKKEFEATDFVNEFKISSNAANSYIKIMKDYSLIDEIDTIDSSRKRRYTVTDPKIVFMIENGIKNIG
jgi:hypothetical protein